VLAGGVSPAAGIACLAAVESGGEVLAAGAYVTGSLGGQTESAATVESPATKASMSYRIGPPVTSTACS